MAKYEFQVSALTPVAVADATNFTTLGFMALQGGAATQINNIWSISIGGQATTSAPTFLMLALDSTVGAASITALSSPNSVGPLSRSNVAIAAPAVGFITAGTLPQRATSVAAPKKQFTFNAFGGSAYWHAYDKSECFQIYGASAWTAVGTGGEASLSAFTGGTPGPINCDWIFETE
jgi:hypothetical protein